MKKEEYLFTSCKKAKKKFPKINLEINPGTRKYILVRSTINYHLI